MSKCRCTAEGETAAHQDKEPFLGYLVLQDLASNTVRVYGYLYVQWCDFAMVAGRCPHEPDPLTVRKWASQVIGGLSKLQQARSMIKHLCRMLEVEDVSSSIPLPRQGRLPRSRALSPEQARKLARTADQAGLKGLAVLVALYTGARRAEVAQLAWDDVDFANRTITLNRPKTRDRHTVPMHTHLHVRLRIRKVDGDAWVFPGRWGGHVAPAVIWEWVKEVAADAGIGHVTPHQLRHTLVGAVYDIGRDLRAAQDIAGHTDPAITARYSSRGPEKLREALEAVDWFGEDDSDG